MRRPAVGPSRAGRLRGRAPDRARGGVHGRPLPAPAPAPADALRTVQDVQHSDCIRRRRLPLWTDGYRDVRQGEQDRHRQRNH